MDSQRGRFRFNTRPVNEGFMLSKVDLEQDLFQVRCIYLVTNTQMMVEHNLFARNLT